MFYQQDFGMLLADRRADGFRSHDLRCWSYNWLDERVYDVLPPPTPLWFWAVW